MPNLLKQLQALQAEENMNWVIINIKLFSYYKITKFLFFLFHGLVIPEIR